MIAPMLLRQISTSLSIGLLLLGSFVTSASPVLAANGTVGTGSPASCTEADFDTVYFSVIASGGGSISFNCGPAPHLILFSTLKSVSANIALEGADLITLSGGNATSLFQVFADQTLTLNHMILSRSYGVAGAVENFGSLVVSNSQMMNNAATSHGGAITNYGNLSLSNAVISGNSAAGLGGGVYTDGGTSAISNSQFTNNTAKQGGGGVAAASGAALTVSDSQFSDNRSTDTFAEGGAIYSAGTLAISQSTFFQNSSSRGGAVCVKSGTTNVTQSTFNGNWAAYGGAIRQDGGLLNLTDVGFSGNGFATNGTKVTTGGGALSWGNGTAALKNVAIIGNWASYGGGFDHENGATTLTNVTFSGNSAVGGGAFDQAAGSIALINVTIANNAAPFFAGGISNRGGTVTLQNTLLSGNLNPDNNQKTNCYKPITTHSFSLSNDFSCTFGTGRDNIDLLLGPLANNGGFTPNHLLQIGSPAIDTGTGAGCPATDQRGITRPQGQACDIGAVEVILEDLAVTYALRLPLVIR